jgi:hypothetical protein
MHQQHTDAIRTYGQCLSSNFISSRLLLSLFSSGSLLLGGNSLLGCWSLFGSRFLLSSGFLFLSSGSLLGYWSFFCGRSFLRRGPLFLWCSFFSLFHSYLLLGLVIILHYYLDKSIELIYIWRAIRDSNPGPLAPEANALSI